MAQVIPEVGHDGGVIGVTLGPNLASTLQLFLGSGPVAGILVESGTGFEKSVWLAVGLGINLAHAPRDVERPAIAFAEVMSTPPPLPGPALDVLASRFAHWLSIWNTQGFAPIAHAWTQRAQGLGQMCEARLPNQTHRGIAEGLDPDGALRLRLADGVILRITAGDVFFGEA